MGISNANMSDETVFLSSQNEKISL